jgi:hypothetical protein
MKHSADSLRLELLAPVSARAYEPVAFTLRAHNTTARTLELCLRGREIAFDIVIADAQGRHVWRRLDGEMIPAILRLEALAPHAALELAAQWSGGEAGDYTAYGELLTDGDPLRSPPVRLRLR